MSRNVIMRHDGKSVLVVTEKGALRTLFVPFKVRCIHPVENIPENSYVFVELVIMDNRYRLLYWINQRMIPYDRFSIRVDW